LAFADRPKGGKADTIIVIIPMDSSLAAPGTHPSNVTAFDTSHVRSIPGTVTQDNLDSSRAVSTTPTTEQVSEYRSDTLHLFAVPKKTHNKPDSSYASVPEKGHNKPDTSQASAGAESAHNRASSATGIPHNNGPAGTTYNSSTPTTRELNKPKPDSSQRRPETKLQLVNTDCHNFATDYDVDKLRVKLLEITKDDDKIASVKKIFKTKCFTTKQIKALSEVFTTDATRFHFFEAAYPFVSDDRFRELIELLTDPVYNGKFRAMTGQR
jgi:hypothetical protein